MKKMLALLGAAGTVLLAVVGCAGPATVHNQAGAAFTAVSSGALTAPVDYKTLTLAVPSQADIASAATLAPSAALNVCAANAYTCPTDSGTATIQLARASTDSGGTLNADGSVTRAINNRLVYVLTWANANCPAHGGAVQPEGAVVAPPVARTCTAVVLVDAASGKGLGMLQISTPTGA